MLKSVVYPGVGITLAAIAATAISLLVNSAIDAIVEAELDEGRYITIDTLESAVLKRLEAEREAVQVVTDWEADTWATSDDGVIEFNVYATKARGECRFITDADGQVGTRAALAMVDGRPTKIDVEFLKDAVPGASRPSGAQFFNRWRLTPPEGQRIDPGEIRLETAHFCPDGGVGPNGEETGEFEFQSAGPFYYPGIPGDAPSGLPKVRLPKPLEKSE